MAARQFPLSLLLRLFLSAILLGMVQMQAGCGGNNDNPILFIPVSGTVSGVVTYEDKEYGQNGFTTNVLTKTVRYAEIELVNSFTSAVLASTLTDASGAYSLSYTTYIGVPTKLRVIANAGPTGSPVAEVRNLRGQVYAVSVSVLSSTVNIFIPVSSPAGGAFNILDVLTSGAAFVNSLEGAYPAAVVAYWEANTSGPYGTAYCSGACIPGPGIYLIGNSGGDTDGYDDDVIWHEYGHFIAETFSRDDSQGGTHYLGQNDLDLRLAWSEGWGDFLPGAVKTWLYNAAPSSLSVATGMPLSWYVDTLGTGFGVRFDVNVVTDSYASNELSVAKVLWELMNIFDMTAVWGVVDGYIQTVTTPTNLEAFWDGWITQRNPGQPEIDILWTIYGNRQIYYKLDSYENDSSFVDAKPISVGVANEQIHYLYQSGSDDYDFVSFDAAAQPYTVNTIDLKNGAYPVITVYAPGAPNPSFLASGFTPLSFTPAAPGTYYIEISSAPSIPLSKGRYGTYTLMIN